MAQYINKDAAVAEIERMQEAYISKLESRGMGHEKAVMASISYVNGMKDVIDTLDVQSLWHDAQGTDLPEIDREVVVFIQKRPGGSMQTAVAHRPNPNGWDGKDIFTGKKRHHTPVTYGKGGWNVPDVKFWLDVELPNPYGEE